MKTLYLNIALLLTLFSQSIYAQHLTITDSCSQAKISITSIPIIGKNILYTYYGDGSKSVGYLNVVQRQNAFWTVYNYALPGTYTIKNIYTIDSVLIFTSFHTFTHYCDYIHIQAFLDNNNNCVYNIGDSILKTPLDVEIDSAGVIIDTIRFLGSYYYKGNPGTGYKFRALTKPAGATAICPFNGIISVVAPTSGNSTSIAFGFQCGNSSQFDFGVAMVGMFRPVATSTLILHAYNNGCSSSNAVVTLNLNKKYIYKTASPLPLSVTGNTITWNVAGLSINNTGTIYVYADTAVGANININDTICNTVSISPITGDLNSSDNALTQCDKVRASWDPNNKIVIPEGDITPGTLLTYTINFENEGNDTAFNVYILDALPVSLDLSSFKILNSSHPVSFLVADATNGQKIARFDFVNIRLADKTHPNNNKGFVQFSINAKMGLKPLTEIKNNAYIYFDVNPPIVTNFTQNRIPPADSEHLSIQTNIGYSYVTVYPNPVTDILTINAEQDDFESLTLANSMGQVVRAQPTTAGTSQIDMKQLPAGLYFLQLKGKNGTSTQKVEKL